LALQSAKPAAQAPTLHVELTQAPSAALLEAQAFWQVPQLSGSILVKASHPFFASASQLPNPGAQVMPQRSYAQVGVPWVPSHVLPQLPQLLTLLAVLASHPSATALLQSR
jgi:hypothetical protein